MVTDPNAAAAAWVAGLQSAGPKIEAGINAVTEAPGAAAARQVNVWLQNTTAAKDKWQRKVGAVSLQSWKNAAITKGLPRISAGATAAQPKFQQFMVQLLPAVAASVSSLPPRGNLDANITRMTSHVRNMAKFSYTPTGQ